jgi:hypothetical protein
MTYEQFSLVLKTLCDGCPEHAERWYGELMDGVQKLVAAKIPEIASAFAEHERDAVVKAAMTAMAKPRGES